jgi:hypothetical protein
MGARNETNYTKEKRTNRFFFDRRASKLMARDCAFFHLQLHSTHQPEKRRRWISFFFKSLTAT